MPAVRGTYRRFYRRHADDHHPFGLLGERNGVAGG